MSAAISGPFRLLSSTASWSSRTQSLALRYYAHIASCQDPTDALMVNVFLPLVTQGLPPPDRSWITAQGFLYEGTRGAGADVEVTDHATADPPITSDAQRDCLISVTGKLHKRSLFSEECALVEVNKHDGLWYIGVLASYLVEGSLAEIGLGEEVTFKGAYAGCRHRTDDSGPVLLVKPNVFKVTSWKDADGFTKNLVRGDIKDLNVPQDAHSQDLSDVDVSAFTMDTDEAQEPNEETSSYVGDEETEDENSSCVAVHFGTKRKFEGEETDGAKRVRLA